jgi:CheY-like chemotaxis protein
VTRANRPILVVDDNDDDATLAIRVLSEDSGPEIERAHDGEEACAYLFDDSGDERRPLPRMVLLDLHMPRLDGLGVLQRIRADERTRLLPVVMLTSSDAEDDVVRSYRLGVNGFVRKPVDQDQFRAALRALRSYWLNLNEVPPERVS